MKRQVIICQIFLFICPHILFANSPKPRWVSYTIQYQEEVISSYNNLLKKTSISDFKKYRNIWEGKLFVNSLGKDEVNVKVILNKKISEGDHPQANTGTAKEYSANITIKKKNKALSEICYNAYPGRDADVVIKNILSTIQSFKSNDIHSEEYEKYPDGIFKVKYNLIHNQAKAGYNLILKEKISERPRLNNTLYNTHLELTHCQ